MRSILFVCTANQFRSPIAAANFSRKLSGMVWGKNWIVRSAGTWAASGSPALPVAIAIARTMSLSLGEHQASAITPKLVSTQDLILVMESEQKESLQNNYPLFRRHIYQLSEIVDNKIEDLVDPVMSRTDNYVEIAAKIAEMAQRGFYKICTKALEAGAYRHDPHVMDLPPLAAQTSPAIAHPPDFPDKWRASLNEPMFFPDARK